MRIPNHNHLTKRRDGFARERKIGIPCSYSCCWSDARPHVSPAHLPPIPRTSFDSHPTDPNAQRHSPSIRPTRRHPSHLHSTSALLLISRYSCLAALPFLHDPFPVAPPVNTPSHRPEILPQSPPHPPWLGTKRVNFHVPGQRICRSPNADLRSGKCQGCALDSGPVESVRVALAVFMRTGFETWWGSVSALVSRRITVACERWMRAMDSHAL